MPFSFIQADFSGFSRISSIAAISSSLTKPFKSEPAFIDIAIDHGLASPDTADKTYRKALGKMKKELKKKDIS
jgi:hypothetical protein